MISGQRTGVDRDGPHRYEKGHAGLGASRAAAPEARSPVFRGRAGSLVKIVWHDGIGMSLYAKRLEKGRFIWPSARDGVVSLTASQLACLLEGVDWRNPRYSCRPLSAG